jgi:hypothetical protein
MPFCPQCEAEYEAGVDACTDCGVALVADLPPDEAPDTADGEPVALRNFANAAEASLVRDLQEENGIRAYVSGGDFTVAPSMFSGEIVLMVDERDLDRATALYDAYFGENAPPVDETPSQVPEDAEDGTQG